MQWTRCSFVCFPIFFVTVLALTGGGARSDSQKGGGLHGWGSAETSVPDMFRDRVLDLPLPEHWAPVYRYMSGKGTGQFCAVYAHQGDYGGAVLTVTSLVHHLTEPRVVIEAGNPLNVVAPTPRAMLAAAIALRGDAEDEPRSVLVMGSVSGHPLVNFAVARWSKAEVHLLERHPDFLSKSALAVWEVGRGVRTESGTWAEFLGARGGAASYDLIMQDDVCACCGASCQTLDEQGLSSLYSSALAPSGVYLRTLGRYTMDSLRNSPPGVLSLMQRVFDQVILLETGRDGGEKIAIGIKGDRRSVSEATLSDVASSLTSFLAASARPPRVHEL